MLIEARVIRIATLEAKGPPLQAVRLERRVARRGLHAAPAQA